MKIYQISSGYKTLKPERKSVMKKFNKEEKFIIGLIIIAIIGIAINRYANWLIKTTEQQTIESAVLVESNEDGYVLSFNGEEYWYTFD